MHLATINERTEGTFFRCLHDETPEDPEAVALRRRWYQRYHDKGLRAKLLFDDAERVVGLCQYLPIEHSPFLGRDLLAILCIWVHGYEYLVGNQQGRGYGRFILDHIEADARRAGAKGVAAWGMDFRYWNPVSFYEHMGYQRADHSDPVVLCWKPFDSDAERPALMRPLRSPAPGARTKLTVFLDGWCMGACGQCVEARRAMPGLEERVDHEEIDTADREAMRAWGIADGVYIDGRPFRPFAPPWTSDELRAELIERAENRQGMDT